MDDITEVKLEQRYGPEIGEALFRQLEESLGSLKGVMLIDAALDMQAQQVAQRLGRELTINYGSDMPPPISGDQLARIIGALGGGRDRGMER